MMSDIHNISDEQELQDIEAHLAGALRPVRAPQDAQARARARIRIPTREELAYRLGDWRRLYLALGSAMLGMLLLVTLGRALYFLTGRSVK